MATVTKSPWVGGLKGRMVNVYFMETPGGTQMRALPGPRKSRSPGETAQMRRVAILGAAWQELDGEAMKAWATYARSLSEGATMPKTRPVSGYNAFSALGSTVLRLGIDRPVPTLPPTALFFGDAVTVVAAGTLPTGGGQGGGVLFSATRPNAPGVLTELLLQPLANAARAIRPKAYASQGFVAFADGALSAEVAAKPGCYACAYRFVLEETGQETAIAPCGVVRVEF